MNPTTARFPRPERRIAPVRDAGGRAVAAIWRCSDGRVVLVRSSVAPRRHRWHARGGYGFHVEVIAAARAAGATEILMQFIDGRTAWCSRASFDDCCSLPEQAATGEQVVLRDQFWTWLPS